jgi:acetyl-CoA synthetase
VDAEHPLYLLYTSGSTGKPKGIQHSSAGYLLNAKMTTRWVFDLKEDDVFWCTADVGWVTGHTYVAYGPLAAGATVMMYEGAPTFPDGGRFWQICQTQGVTILYTAPTAIRALMKLGDALPAKYDLGKLRLLGSVGEPINPEAWMWYHRVIGGGRCPIVDTWWQTETGATMMTPIPSVTPAKPGSCAKPLPGIFADIVDDEGRPVAAPDGGGYLVITRPWPSMLRTIWGDNERYVRTYWEKFQNRYYVAGDSARRDKDGYYWIMGRIDDVLNIAGHRLGTMEIESALVAHPHVAEAAVVSKHHEIKGESAFAYVVLNVPRPEGAAAKALIEELRAWVGEQLSPIAKPDEIRLTDNLPKTRSGKIMRRLLRAIARGEEITQDMSTLENPGILEQLRGGGAAAPIEHAAPGKRAAPNKRDEPAKRAAPTKSAPPAKPGAPAKRAAPTKSAPPAKPAAPAKQAVPAKRAAPAKPAAQSKRTKASKKGAARPKPKRAAKPARSVKAAKKTKVAAKRRKQAARGKKTKRKAVTTRPRHAAVKAARGKPRGKK